MSDKKILKNYSEIIFKLKDIMNSDMCTVVTDTEKVLMYRSGEKMILPLKENDKIKAEHKIIQAVLSKNEAVHEPHVEKEVYGIPFEAFGYPIRNKKEKLIGAIVICVNISGSKDVETALFSNIENIGDLHSKFGEALEYSDGISQEVQDISAATQELYASVEEIASTAEEVGQLGVDAKSLSDEIKDRASEGSNSLNQILTTVEKTASLADTITNQIDVLRGSMNQIDNMVSLINSISEQTNLLALNASIEAARAGEHGRGFAVVADEVSKLAEQSKTATQDIVEVVKTIGLDIDKVVETVNQSNSLSKESVETANHTTERISSILGNVENLGDYINKISDRGSAQRDMTSQISRGIENLANSSQSVSDNAEELNGFMSTEYESVGLIKEEVEVIKETLIK